MTLLPAFRWYGVAVLLACAVVSSGQIPNVILPATAPPQPITAAEYFFDTDPGFGNATPWTVTPGTTTTAALATATAALEPGVHNYAVRTKDQGGNWSHTQFSWLYVLDPALSLPATNSLAAITKAEYFLDNDPGVGNAIDIPVTNGTIVNLPNLVLDITSVVPGTHKLFVRVKDQQNRWSLVSPGTLNIVNQSLDIPGDASPAPIVAFEYFFDTDPGFSNGTALPVTPANNLNLSDLASISALPVGSHKYFIRGKDQKGNWGHSQYGTLSIITTTIDLPADAAPEPLTALEYFVDSDPGFGNGTIVPVTPAQNLNNYTLNVAIPGLADGTHSLWIRALRPSSISMVRSFYVGIPLPLDFIHFSVTRENNNGLVQWEIAEGYKTGFFEVERSTDGKRFDLLGTVTWNNMTSRYEWNDSELDGLDVPVVYYRIKSVEQGGTARYTQILSLQLAEDAYPYAYVFPNPVKDVLKVQVNTKGKQELDMVLVDNNGRVLIRQKQQQSGREQEIELDLSDYTPGIYHLNLKAGDWTRNLKVIKQ